MIKKLLFTATLLGILSLYNTAYATKWVKLVKSNERLIELDRESIRTQGYITTVWVKFTIQNDLTKDGLAIGDYTQSLYYIHCINKSFSEKQSTNYKKDGHQIRSYYNDIPKYEEIPNNTIIESIFNAVCPNHPTAAALPAAETVTTTSSDTVDTTNDTATWLKIAQTDEFNVELNRQSVRSKDGIYKAWIKSTVYKDLNKDKLAVGDYTQDLYYIDCQHKTASKVQGIAYKQNGNSIGSFRKNSPIYNSIAAGSIEESIFYAVCHRDR